MPQGCQEAAPTPSRILCSCPTLAREVLTCSSGPGAALTYSLVPGASNPGPDVGLEDLGAFAVAIQAKAQMRLRCLGKGLHLQEGRGQPLLRLIPQACSFSSEPKCSPYLSWEYSMRSGSPYLGALSTRSCSYGSLASRTQLGVSLGGVGGVAQLE